LKQGSMSVEEYVTRFTQLSCYAPNEVDIDENKQECFLNDLNDGWAYALEAWDFEKKHEYFASRTHSKFKLVLNSK
jgi:hypothetical protein